MGIEPTCPAWKAGVLPLNYTRMKIELGVTGFEPATSWSQTRRSSQAEPHPVRAVNFTTQNVFYYNECNVSTDFLKYKLPKSIFRVMLACKWNIDLGNNTKTSIKAGLCSAICEFSGRIAGVRTYFCEVVCYPFSPIHDLVYI